jgi:hypothetical protein
MDVTEHHNLHTGEGSQRASVEDLEPGNTLEQQVQLVSQVEREISISVGQTDLDAMKVEGEAGRQMAQPPPIPVAAYCVHRGERSQLGEYIGHADVSGVQDSLHIGLLEYRQHFLWQTMGSVGDVGVSDHTQSNRFQFSS